MKVTLGQEEELVRTTLDGHYRKLLRETATADNRDLRCNSEPPDHGVAGFLAPEGRRAIA